MTNLSKKEFVNIVTDIKNEIKTTQIRTAQQVNSNLIMMYFRILRRMRVFYEEYKNDKKCAQLVLKLSWGHNILLLSKIKNIKTREPYIRATIENGWSFVGNQYKITVGDEDYFIDLLFYHLKLKCYVVVELKATKFIPEFAGKMNFYLSAVDDLIKTDDDNPSIGLILCKDKNKFTTNYSIKDINKPIGISSYELTELLPNEDELNLHIDIEE